MPLLQEYFYDDWENGAVLNNNGFVLKSNSASGVGPIGLGGRRPERVRAGAHRRRPLWTDATAYRKIYETARAAAADLAQRH